MRPVVEIFGTDEIYERTQAEIQEAKELRGYIPHPIERLQDRPTILPDGVYNDDQYGLVRYTVLGGRVVSCAWTG